MTKFGGYPLERITKLRYRLDQELRRSTCLQKAAQSLCDALYEEFEETTVLVRLFGTVPYKLLPEPDRRFVARLADGRGCRSELNDETVTVSLLGTRGKQESWNDRYKSSSRLAIPLVSASFIKTIPMVARLLSGMGTKNMWIERQNTRILVKTFGRMAQVLYVDHAQTATTVDGHKIVATQHFVASQRIQTVLGLGGAYLSGALVSILIFTKEHFPQEQAERFLPLVITFKTATTENAMNNRIFE